VKIRGHPLTSKHAKRWRQRSIESRDPLDAGKALVINISMSALSDRMHARVSASRAMNPNLAARDAMKSTFQFVLDGFAMALTLPAGEMATIVGDDELEPLRHRDTYVCNSAFGFELGRLSRYPCKIIWAAT